MRTDSNPRSFSPLTSSAGNTTSNRRSALQEALGGAGGTGGAGTGSPFRAHPQTARRRMKAGFVRLGIRTETF